MSLHALMVGSGRPQVAFLHGLFGQGRNWNRIAQALVPEYPSVLLDLPNHGRSPWTDGFDYRVWADIVAEDISERLGSAARLAVVGHSLGGKVAMMLALRHPTLVRGLVVMDIAPDASSHGYGMAGYVRAMRGLDLSRITDRRSADESLAPSIADPGVRAFLLQNLRQRHGAWSWQPNLDLLGEALPAISGWVDADAPPYEGPVLWVRGAQSEYVRDEHIAAMGRLFPAATLVTIPGAGHWVHTDAPEAVVDALRGFLDAL